jgi:hypothetical protein
MFIGLLKSRNDKYNELRLETDTFEEAWQFLWQNIDGVPELCRAVVLEDVRWSDGHYLHPYKEVAAMRIVR